MTTTPTTPTAPTVNDLIDGYWDGSAEIVDVIDAILRRQTTATFDEVDKANFGDGWDVECDVQEVWLDATPYQTRRDKGRPNDIPTRTLGQYSPSGTDGLCVVDWVGVLDLEASMRQSHESGRLLLCYDIEAL